MKWLKNWLRRTATEEVNTKPTTRRRAARLLRMRTGVTWVIPFLASTILNVNFASSAESGRCEFFSDPSALATCNTISNMYPGLSDEELRERVSKTHYGVSADKIEEVEAKREAERRRQEERVKAEDQCYRLYYGIPEELEICRTLRMLTYRERSDAELQAEVGKRKEEIRKEKEKQRRSAVAAEESRKTRAKEAAQALDKQLGRAPLGFFLRSWERGGFNTVMIIHFHLQNNSKETRKDFAIKCDTHANSGTAVGTLQKTLYEMLQPGQRRSFSLNMGAIHSQASRASCAVVGSQ